MTAAAVRAGLLRTIPAFILLTAVVATLSARVPDRKETPLVSPDAAGIPVPIELSYDDYPGSRGHHSARIRLHVGNPESLLRHDSLEITVATYSTRPSLDVAQISVSGTECVFTTRKGASYSDNAALVFVRGTRCFPVRGMPTGELVLAVRFSGAGRLGLWTLRPRGAPTEPDVIYLTDPLWSELGLQVALNGRYFDSLGLSRYRRIDLLSYMWDASDSRWIWYWVGTSDLLLILGAIALPSSNASRRRVLRSSIAAGLLASGLALLYVVLVPPFQAPDEVSHFYGYAEIVRSGRLRDEITEWAARTHFSRLHNRPQEQFRPGDVGRPYPSALEGVRTLGFDRSALTVREWQATSHWLSDWPAAQQLVAVRAINAAVFSLAIAVSVAVIGFSTGAQRPESAIAMLLLAPTLPFFGTHVSNYAPAVAAYAILASGCLSLLMDGPRAWLAGLPLGIGLAAAIAATRNALPMALLVSLLIAARAVLGGRQPGGSAWPIAAFWGGILAGGASLHWLLTPDYAQGLSEGVAYFSGGSTVVRALVSAHPRLAGAATIAMLMALELSLRRSPAQPWRRRLASIVEAVIPACCTVGIALIAANVMASLVTTLPHLRPIGSWPNIDRTVSLSTYLYQTMATIVSPFRIYDSDLLLSTTFWGAFGWVDAFLPSAAIATVSLACAGALTMLLFFLAIGRDARRFTWLVVLAAAWLATVAAYAVTSFTISPDLHGRYLIGPYLVAILVGWSPALAIDDARGISATRARLWLAGTAWLLMGVGQMLAPVIILRRYF